MTESGPDRKSSRRLSITKLQRQSAAGADLIALCQTVTEDGSLSDEEVSALRQWLADNRSTHLPARDYLFHTVESIVADGRVTGEERKQLYRALETILPPDIRSPIRERRKEREQAEQDQARAQREAAKQAQREERERSRPVGSWNFMVAGVRYEGRPEVISRYAATEDTAYLIRDRENRFSRNAVEIRLPNGMQIGFVPEDVATEMAPLLDAGHPHEAFITKILTGGRSPIPVVQAYLYRLDAAVPDIVLEKHVPARMPPPRQAGCAASLALVTSAALASVAYAWHLRLP